MFVKYVLLIILAILLTTLFISLLYSYFKYLIIFLVNFGVEHEEKKDKEKQVIKKCTGLLLNSTNFCSLLILYNFKIANLNDRRNFFLLDVITIFIK